ncbi:MAG TPA: hypothetical protein VIC59_02710 [Gemmatimonadota bacterium]|jgi:hypothetical protein
MNADPSSVPASEYRVRARRLLKQLRSEDRDVAAAAAERFLRLHEFTGATASRVLERRDRVRLKHALTVVAVENGAPSWLALKARAEAEAPSDDVAANGPRGPVMYEPQLDALLNRWFATYDVARTSLERGRGFLLPYRDHYFVCESEGVRALGLDPDDPDWERIGWDWVKPGDREAWRRLSVKRERALRGER